ncbi:MAG: TlyA family RNA methyltransferase [Bacteroidales bacterium]
MKRLDIYLVEKGLAQSREKAKDSIQKGLVSVNGTVITKPSFNVDDNANVEFNAAEAMPFVGRGGLKLEKAIVDFNLGFKDKYILDVGASTGGFTHCALQHGAAFVWAVDVGTNQLDSSLKINQQVCSMEECDIRTLEESAIPRKVDFIVADLSFISLTMVAPFLPKFLTPNGAMMLLIKPQFEAGRVFVGKNGLVKNPKVHVDVINRVAEAFGKLGYSLSALSHSPIYSKEKNIEYLAFFSHSNLQVADVKQKVNFAFEFQKKL